MSDHGVVTVRRTRNRQLQRKSFLALVVEKSAKASGFKTLRFEDNHCPTSLKRTMSGKYYAVPFSKSDMVLIDRLDHYVPTGDYVYDFHGSVVSSHIIGFHDRSYVYYINDQEIRPTTPEILSVLARHFMGDYNYYYNAPCDIDMLKLVLPKKNLQFRHSQKSIKYLEKPKISGEHHIHFTAAEVCSCLNNDEKARALHAFRLPKDITTSFMAGVILWLASISKPLWNIIVESGLLDVYDVAHFGKSAKLLSIQAKSCQNLVEQDLRELFEVDVLVNRAYGKVDWQGEMEHRTEPRLAEVDAAEVYDIAVKIFSNSDPTKDKPMSLKWDKFWETRWQWSAAGSIHTQYVEDQKYIMKDRELKNKFISLISMPEYNIQHFLNRKPALEAWSSIKYEWGKMRAIYGTDLTSYILTHFAFYNCEDTLPMHFPVGKKARPSYVSSRIAAVLENTIPLCIDYEDFNSQHSIPAMQAVMRAYLDVNSDTLSPEQLMAGSWAIDSIANTIVNDNMGLNQTYKAKGTLMSGWRLTTFVNSVLNYIYTSKLIGKAKTVLRSVHNGDDVLLGITNYQVVVDIVKNCEKRKIRLQRTKSAFGGIAEFLRVDHVRGTHGQYLTRNIATLVHSRIESKLAVGMTDVLDAFEERISEFVTRGGSVALSSRLRKNYYNRIAPIFKMSEQDAYDVKIAHRVVGGISSRYNAEIKKMIKTDTTRQSVELSRGLPGIRDYAKRLVVQLQLSVPISEVVDKVYSATLNAVQLVRHKLLVTDNTDYSRYQVWRALYKAYSDVSDNSLFGKAKMAGFVFDVLSQSTELRALSRIISCSKRPLEFLKIIT